MKLYRERGRMDTEVRRGPALLSPGKRSASAHAYGRVPAAPAREEPGAETSRPPLVGPGYGSFMPSLDEAEQMDTEIEGREDAELAAGPAGNDEEAAGEEAALQLEPDQDAMAEPEAQEGEESELAGPDEERGEDSQSIASAEASAADQLQGAAPASAAGDRDDDADTDDAGASDTDGRDSDTRDSDARDSDARDSGAAELDGPDADGDLDQAQPRRLAAIDAGRPVQTRASRRPRATAARLGPIDPPIPRPKPRKKRKPSLDRLLPGRGWRRVGLPGVRMKKVGATTIVAIDRSAKGVRLDTTSAQGRFSLPRQAQRQRAEIALNGDLFNFRTGKPSGLHRRRGRNLSGTKRQAGTGMFAFGDGRAGILSGNNRLPRWADNVVSGRPIIMRNGRVVNRFAPADAPRLNSVTGRSAVGMSRSGRVLFLAASSASTTRRLAQLLKRNGVDDALALDGSGSAQMFVHGKGMVKPGDGRQIANGILVHTRR